MRASRREAGDPPAPAASASSRVSKASPRHGTPSRKALRPVIAGVSTYI
jgi:hypothetical protein